MSPDVGRTGAEASLVVEVDEPVVGEEDCVVDCVVDDEEVLVSVDDEEGDLLLLGVTVAVAVAP